MLGVPNGIRTRDKTATESCVAATLWAPCVVTLNDSPFLFK